MVDLLVIRFEQYFRHHDRAHDVLEPGDRAAACINLRRALQMLGMSVPDAGDERLYDDGLKGAVREFQREYNNRVVDGRVGPGTRALLARALLTKGGPSLSRRLKLLRQPSIFLSYASADKDRVHKLDQWLRDRGVNVLLDERWFEAGTAIEASIRRAVASADKVVVVYSRNSKDRDWPRLERSVAEELERHLDHPVLIYLQLDDSPLPTHDKDRIAIDGYGVPLKEAGTRILQALRVKGVEPRTYVYDEDEPL